ncbi:MAG: ATP-binding cassette domain-containing protein [Candidatus Neomarinimicrobiota bacterium]
MIEVSNLSKEFKLRKRQRREMGEAYRNTKTIKAVDSISFQCTPGRVFGLIGPNGAGKTTTLRMLATMLKPTSGTISVAGFDTQTHPEEVRRRIGFMTGQTALYDRLTPLEMVRYMASLHRMDSSRFAERKEELFTVLGIHDFADRRIARLSSGMKQKVSIARTIIHDPDIVVFDEPTSGLDVMTSRAIIDLIRSCREDKKTVIFSTHRMGEVKLLCDDVAIIHRGKLYFRGTLEKFESDMTQPTFEDEFIHLVGEA